MIDSKESLKRLAKWGGKRPGNISHEEWDAAYDEAQCEEMARLRKMWAWARRSPRLQLIPGGKEGCDGRDH